MHDIAVRTAEHCCICIPGRACVERSLTCVQPPGGRGPKKFVCLKSPQISAPPPNKLRFPLRTFFLICVGGGGGGRRSAGADHPPPHAGGHSAIAWPKTPQEPLSLAGLVS